MSSLTVQTGQTARRVPYGLRVVSICATAAFMGCTHLALTDCAEGPVIGETKELRLKTSHFRVILESQPLAAARFLPYAMMSAYAYRLGDGCLDPGNPRGDEERVPTAWAQEMESALRSPDGTSAGWSLIKIDARLTPSCEDEQGLMFHAWERREGAQTIVTVAFRGTSGHGDWMYGNLWPLTHQLFSENQLTRAADRVEKLIAFYDAKTAAAGEPPARFLATGHSLGGGLAQHVLYAQPKRVEQAIVFDPSSITGFTSLDVARQIEGCSCLPSLGTEGRIIRVYQTYEILSNLRILHKSFFPPERHVQEVRFPFESSWNMVDRHGMQDLAKNLLTEARKLPEGTDTSAWFHSRTGRDQLSGLSCTEALKDAQARSCQIPATNSLLGRCPS